MVAWATSGRAAVTRTAGRRPGERSPLCHRGLHPHTRTLSADADLTPGLRLSSANTDRVFPARGHGA